MRNKVMELITMANVKLYFADRLLLDIPDFKVCSGEKIGIIGDNGSGKTTLFKMIIGDIKADEGNIKVNGIPNYCEQFYSVTHSMSIMSREQSVNNYRYIGKNCKIYSGGEIKRFQLAYIFSQYADVYLLDEPTGNLDYDGIKLLIENLKNLNTYLLISHDRTLLNQCCNKIVEISNSKLNIYEGNYSSYEYQKKLKEERNQFEYIQYITKKKRLQKEYLEKTVRAKKIAKKPKNKGKCIGKECGTKSYSSKAKNMEKSAQVAIKKIEMLEKKEKPVESPKIKMDFRLTNPPENNRCIIQISDLCYKINTKKLFEKFNLSIYNREKVAILGNNGTGKTTLLNFIVDGHPSIRTISNVRFGYLKQNFNNISLDKTVLENVMLYSVQRMEVVCTILARLLFFEDSLHLKADKLSGGERVRLSIAQIIVSDANVLVLDELTNYLDLNSRLVVEEVLKEYPGTILFTSHDIMFVDAIATRKIYLDKKLQYI